jgi:protein gp37
VEKICIKKIRNNPINFLPMNKTSIEWTDYTWNPVTGCNKISAGCKQMHPERLQEPIEMENKINGKKVFVCDVSDLFHEKVTFEFIASVFAVMAAKPLTTFQLLTKRPERALDFYKWCANNVAISNTFPFNFSFPPKNIWLGVSVENQEQADKRIPLLLQIPATVRFLSCEPLIGGIDLTQSLGIFRNKIFQGENLALAQDIANGKVKINDFIHWVIAGGESGHGATPMHPYWVRSLRDQCQAANVPFFFKQWGAFSPWQSEGFFWVNQANQIHREEIEYKKKLKFKIVDRESGEITWFERSAKSKSGNLLDGKQHLQFPK